MIDLDAVLETDDGTRLDKVTAIIIGTVAILAAVLGSIQMDLSQREAHSAALGARYTIQLFDGINGSSARSDFEAQAVQDALTVSITALSRTITVLDHGEEDGDIQDARMRPDLAASERLRSIAAEMGAIPAPGGPLDALARESVSTDPVQLDALRIRQNEAVDEAQRLGEKGGRAVLGLSLVALAGVLVGLAAILGEGQAGRFALGTGAVAVGAAAAAALSTAL